MASVKSLVQRVIILDEDLRSAMVAAPRDIHRQQHPAALGSAATDHDAVVSEAFLGLSREHQRVLCLRVARVILKGPDQCTVDTVGLSFSEIAEISRVPVALASNRSRIARMQLLAVVEGRIKAPYVGARAEAWLRQGWVAAVNATGGIETIRRAPDLLDADDESSVPQQPLFRRRDQISAAAGGGAGRMRRKRVASSYDTAASFYFETATDLIGLWLDGSLTEAAYDSCMTVLEAEAAQ
jgi:hypothetical protein